MRKYNFYEQYTIECLLKSYEDLYETLKFIHKYWNDERLKDLLDFQIRDLQIYYNIAEELAIVKHHK